MNPSKCLTRHVLILDGGGSKVAGLVASKRSDGTCDTIATCTIHGTGSAIPSNWPMAQGNLLAAVESLLELSRLEPQQVDHAVFMLAGAGRPSDVERVTNSLLTVPRIGSLKRMTVQSDVRAMVEYAYRSSPNAPALVAIAGTGSMVAALDRNGRMIRAGGWGPTVGDEASGFRISQLALSELCRWLDDGLPASSHPLFHSLLALMVEKQLVAGVADASSDTLASAILALSNSRSSMAEWTPHILEKSAQGELSTQLEVQFDGQFRALADQIATVYRQAAKSFATEELPWRLYLAGGLARHCAAYRKRLIDAVETSNSKAFQIGEVEATEAALQIS